MSSSPSRDQRHAEADRLFREALTRGIPLVTTNLIIAETHHQDVVGEGADFLSITPPRGLTAAWAAESSKGDARPP